MVTKFTVYLWDVIEIPSFPILPDLDELQKVFSMDKLILSCDTYEFS